MTSQEMMKATLKSGYWWVNVAPLGEKPDWQQQPKLPDDEGNKLFGYDVDEFLAKQYK